MEPFLVSTASSDTVEDEVLADNAGYTGADDESGLNGSPGSGLLEVTGEHSVSGRADASTSNVTPAASGNDEDRTTEASERAADKGKGRAVDPASAPYKTQGISLR